MKSSCVNVWSWCNWERRCDVKVTFSKFILRIFIPVCVDLLSTCYKWIRKGYCSPSSSNYCYMKYFCSRTCEIWRNSELSKGGIMYITFLIYLAFCTSKLNDRVFLFNKLFFVDWNNENVCENSRRNVFRKDEKIFRVPIFCRAQWS